MPLPGGKYFNRGKSSFVDKCATLQRRYIMYKITKEMLRNWDIVIERGSDWLEEHDFYFSTNDKDGNEVETVELLLSDAVLFYLNNSEAKPARYVAEKIIEIQSESDIARWRDLNLKSEQLEAVWGFIDELKRASNA